MVYTICTCYYEIFNIKPMNRGVKLSPSALYKRYRLIIDNLSSIDSKSAIQMISSSKMTDPEDFKHLRNSAIRTATVGYIVLRIDIANFIYCKSGKSSLGKLNHHVCYELGRAITLTQKLIFKNPTIRQSSGANLNDENLISNNGERLYYDLNKNSILHVSNHLDSFFAGNIAMLDSKMINYCYWGERLSFNQTRIKEIFDKIDPCQEAIRKSLENLTNLELCTVEVSDIDEDSNGTIVIRHDVSPRAVDIYHSSSERSNSRQNQGVKIKLTPKRGPVINEGALEPCNHHESHPRSQTSSIGSSTFSSQNSGSVVFDFEVHGRLKFEKITNHFIERLEGIAGKTVKHFYLEAKLQDCDCKIKLKLDKFQTIEHKMQVKQYVEGLQKKIDQLKSSKRANEAEKIVDKLHTITRFAPELFVMIQNL